MAVPLSAPEHGTAVADGHAHLVAGAREEDDDEQAQDLHHGVRRALRGERRTRAGPVRAPSGRSSRAGPAAVVVRM
jgi:hypothetical protein